MPTPVTRVCSESQQAAEEADGRQRVRTHIAVCWAGTGRDFLDLEAQSDSAKQAHSDLCP